MAYCKHHCHIVQKNVEVQVVTHLTLVERSVDVRTHTEGCKLKVTLCVPVPEQQANMPQTLLVGTKQNDMLQAQCHCVQQLVTVVAVQGRRSRSSCQRRGMQRNCVSFFSMPVPGTAGGQHTE